MRRQKSGSGGVAYSIRHSAAAVGPSDDSFDKNSTDSVQCRYPNIFTTYGLLFSAPQVEGHLRSILQSAESCLLLRVGRFFSSGRSYVLLALAPRTAGFDMYHNSTIIPPKSTTSCARIFLKLVHIRLIDKNHIHLRGFFFPGHILKL